MDYSAYINSQSPDIFRPILVFVRSNSTHLLYIINEKIIVFIKDKVMSGQISNLIISTKVFACQCIGQGYF